MQFVVVGVVEGGRGGAEGAGATLVGGGAIGVRAGTVVMGGLAGGMVIGGAAGGAVADGNRFGVGGGTVEGDDGAPGLAATEGCGVDGSVDVDGEVPVEPLAAAL